jgi:hypothetical protein
MTAVRPLSKVCRTSIRDNVAARMAAARGLLWGHKAFGGVVVAVFAVVVALRWAADDGRPAGPRVYAVPASIASDCSRPVEAELHRFLATVPDGATIQFPPNGCYGQDDSLWVVDRHDLTFAGNGSTFRIVTTGRNETYFRSNWRVRRGSGVTFRDMEVVGACAPDQCRNGTPPPPLDGYGQHGFNLESTAGATLERVHVHDVLSDGVEAQGTLDPDTGWAGAPTTDLTIRNSRIERAGRMLIGITNLDGGVIADNYIGNGPMVGIDVELDHPGFVGRNIQILRNTFENIHAQAFANGGIGSDPLVGNIVIEGNVMDAPSEACAGSIWIRTPGPTDPPLFRTRYIVRNNRFNLIGWFLQAEGVKDLVVEGNVVNLDEVGCGQAAAVEVIRSSAPTFYENPGGGRGPDSGRGELPALSGDYLRAVSAGTSSSLASARLRSHRLASGSQSSAVRARARLASEMAYAGSSMS